MRNAIVGTLVTVAALGAASTARADALFGGTALFGSYLAAPSIGLRLSDDGRVTARAATFFACHKQNFPDRIVRLTGAAHGAAFSAKGHTRLEGLGRLNVSLSGTFAGTSATGRVKLSVKGCKGYARLFSLRVTSAPAGAPAMPAPKTAMFGTTSQSVAGIPLPVALRVTKNG